MPDLSAVTTNFFPVASETYSNNLSASIAALATTVPVNANNTYADGDTCVITVEPNTANQATFRGTKASSPARFINCLWTEGNLGVGHALGAVVADYDTATTPSMITKGIKKFADDNGNLLTAAVQAALNQGSVALNGWNALGYAPATVTALGNRSYSLQINGIDLTTTLSPGMRLRTQRTVAAPTQCTLLSGTGQYWSKPSPNAMTFTTAWTCGGWFKFTSYSGGSMMGRRDASNGWDLTLNSNGQVKLEGFNSGLANVRAVTSYQSVPLNKWVHIVAQMDMTIGTPTPTTTYVMIDGVDVPCTVTAGGTSPVAMVQGTGDFSVGAISGAFPMAGKIAQAFVFNAKVSQATARSYMSQGLSGTEPNLVSAYPFNGNGNDLNLSNANNLTSNGGTTATTADSPFGLQGDNTINSLLDYGLVMQGSFAGGNSTFTVQVPEGNTISTTGISAVAYSSNRTPFGFINQKPKWQIESIIRIGAFQASPVQFTRYNVGNMYLTFGPGDYTINYQGTLYADRSAAGPLSAIGEFASVANASTVGDIRFLGVDSSPNTSVSNPVTVSAPMSVTTQSTRYLNMYTAQTSITNLYQRGDLMDCRLFVEPSNL